MSTPFAENPPRALVRTGFLFPIFIVLLTAAIVVAAWFLSFDGEVHEGWARMVGRTHPVLVHFPIAFLLLVPVLEIGGRFRPELRVAAGFVLPVAFFGAIVAVLAGIALSYAEGREGALLTRHLWGGVAVVVGTAAACLLRNRWRTSYYMVLGATVAGLGWAAHQGGSLTHGETYFTDPLPAGLKRLLRIPEPPPPEVPGADTAYGILVRPVLEKHCINCHGSERQKGDLRLDSLHGLLASGSSGRNAIVPRDADASELVQRMRLPRGHSKVMPPKDKPRLSDDERFVLAWWVEHGASPDKRLAEFEPLPLPLTRLLAAGNEPTKPAVEVAPVIVGDYSGMQHRIAELQRELGIRLLPLSRKLSDGLALSARNAGAFGDPELARLEFVAPFIVEADLAGTAVTDDGLGALTRFQNLTRLHLERTGVTGRRLAELAGLARLRYLNLCYTSFSDQQVAQVGQLSSLRSLYAFGSSLTPAGAARLADLLPLCTVGPVEPGGLPTMAEPEATPVAGAKVKPPPPSSRLRVPTSNAGGS